MNSIKEQIAVVQHYINIRRNKAVQISIKNQRDVFMLAKAYSTASRWFTENGYKIEVK